MREKYEFRINEEHAHLLFGPEEGKRCGIIARSITLFSDDERFQEIGIIKKRMLRETGELFFFSWYLERGYTKKELAEASLFHLPVFARFEPTGEDCGTLYDESASCDICGAGARQLTPLRLPCRRIPKSRDIAKTIGGELVVSQRFVDFCTAARATGITFHKIVDASSRPGLPAWYQFVPDSSLAEIIPPTRTGNNPFDEDERNEYRCSKGDTIGLNLLSEIFVRKQEASWPDFVFSRQFVGRRGGFLRPEAQIIVSQRMGRLLATAGLIGCRLEVVRQRP